MPEDPASQHAGPLWLDLTRTLTRTGRAVPTGIDRVELAWFDHLRKVEPGFLCLFRTTRGFLLVPSEAAERLVAASRGQLELGPADIWSRLSGRGQRARHRAEALVRPHAADRCLASNLVSMVRRQSPRAYLNVGHVGWEAARFSALRSCGIPITILVHDIIPLTHPDLVPPEVNTRFAEGIEQVRKSASLVFVVSDDTRRRLQGHWSTAERSPHIDVAKIGIPEIPRRSGPPREPGRFLMVGTLEPRKNHATILRTWSRLAEIMPPEDLPRLYIYGNEGYRGAEVRTAITSHPLFGSHIFWSGGAHDDVLSEEFTRADALLYPSLAEGFGLPPWEALDHGALPICADLPVLHELLGEHAVYVDPVDDYAWSETIRERLSGSIPGPGKQRPLRPDWPRHFETVLGALATPRR